MEDLEDLEDMEYLEEMVEKVIHNCTLKFQYLSSTYAISTYANSSTSELMNQYYR